MYQHIFLGYCFSCHNFGHKALDCKSYRNIIIKVFKDMAIRTTSLVAIKGVETIIHFRHYNITILNARNAAIMVIKLVIVDYQKIP